MLALLPLEQAYNYVCVCVCVCVYTHMHVSLAARKENKYSVIINVM